MATHRSEAERIASCCIAGNRREDRSEWEPNDGVYRRRPEEQDARPSVSGTQRWLRSPFCRGLTLTP